jgi:hypothetical protein
MVEAGPELRLAYPDVRPTDRDDNDVLWMRELDNTEGVPEFAIVSAIRQRAAMLNRLCQVCGEPISGPIEWTFAQHQIERRDGETITASPPTCKRCAGIAERVCPALARHHERLLVHEYRVWGYYGQVFELLPEDSATPFTLKHRKVRLDDKETLPRLIAKQLYVELVAFEEAT